MFTSHISMKSCDIFTEPRSTEWTFSSLFHIILCDYLSDGYLYLSLSLSLSLYLSRSPRGLCVCLLMCVSRCVCRLCVSPMMCMCTTTTVCVSRCVCHGVTSMCVKRLHIRVSQCHSVCMTERVCHAHTYVFSPLYLYLTIQ